VLYNDGGFDMSACGRYLVACQFLDHDDGLLTNVPGAEASPPTTPDRARRAQDAVARRREEAAASSAVKQARAAQKAAGPPPKGDVRAAMARKKKMQKLRARVWATAVPHFPACADGPGVDLRVTRAARLAETLCPMLPRAVRRHAAIARRASTEHTAVCVVD